MNEVSVFPTRSGSTSRSGSDTLTSPRTLGDLVTHDGSNMSSLNGVMPQRLGDFTTWPTRHGTCGEVIRVIERLQLVLGAHIDCNFRQGREAVLAQLQVRTEGEVNSLSEADKYITHFQEDLVDICNWVAPHQLPDDYVFFLEFYGGVLVETESYSLIVDGIGPMVEDWYGFLMGDDGLYEGGLLKIGLLTLRREGYDYVSFFLDLTGVIHQYGVIGIPLWRLEGTDFLAILKEPHAHPTSWTKLADSFTDWLEQAAATGGMFAY